MRADVSDRVVRKALLRGLAVDDSCSSEHFKVLILQVLLIIQLFLFLLVLQVLSSGCCVWVLQTTHNLDLVDEFLQKRHHSWVFIANWRHLRG